MAAAAIADLLGDGVARTFDRIDVELYDRTADMLARGPVDRALWRLEDEGRPEFANKVPVYFPLRPAAVA